MERRLLQVGYLLLELAEALRRNQASDEITGLVNRALQDLAVIEDGERISLRPAAEIPSQSLQSLHVPEATYRKKGGDGGYVRRRPPSQVASNDLL